MSATGKSYWNKLLTFVLVLFIFTSNFAGMAPLLGVASAYSDIPINMGGVNVDLGHYYNDGDGNGYWIDDFSPGYSNFISRTISPGQQPLPNNWAWTKSGTYAITEVKIIDLTLSGTTNHWVYDTSISDYYLYRSDVPTGPNVRPAPNVYGYPSFSFVHVNAEYDYLSGSSSIFGLPVNGDEYFYETNFSNYVFNFYYGGSTPSSFTETPYTASYSPINIGDLYHFEADHHYQVLFYYDKIASPGPYSYLHVIHNYDGIMVSDSIVFYDCEEINDDRISSGLYNFEHRKHENYMGYNYVYDSMTLHYETHEHPFSYYDTNSGSTSDHTETFVVGDVFDAAAHATQVNFNNSSFPQSGTVWDVFTGRGFSSLIEPNASYSWVHSPTFKILNDPSFYSSSWSFLFGALNPLVGSPITYFQNNTVNLLNENSLPIANYEYTFEEGLHYVLVINYSYGIPVTHHYLDGLTEETFVEGKFADPNVYTNLHDWKRDKPGYTLVRTEVIESASWLNISHYGLSSPVPLATETRVVLDGATAHVDSFLVQGMDFSGYTVVEDDLSYWINRNRFDILTMNAGKNILNLFYSAGTMPLPMSISTIVSGSYLRTIWDDNPPFGGGPLGDRLTNAKYQFSSGKMYEVHYYYVKGSPTTYTLTYDANGADSGSVPVDNIAYPHGSYAIVQPNSNLQKSGYELICWNDKADGSGQSYYPGISYANTILMDDDKILYAMWSKPLNVPVTHHYLNNADSSPYNFTDSETKIPATNIPILLNDWYKIVSYGSWGSIYEPYRIVVNESQGGITTSVVFNTNVMHDPQLFTFLNNNDYDVTIYYAVYSSPVDVIYFPNGADSGAVPIDILSPYTIFSSAVILDNIGVLGDGTDILKKTGDTFTGWNTKADGTGTSFAPGASVILDYSTTEYDFITYRQALHLHAQWGESGGGTDVSVTYNAMGGTFDSAAVIVTTPSFSGLTYDYSQTDSFSNELLVVSDVPVNSLITEPSPATIKGTDTLEGWYTTSTYDSGTEWNFGTDAVTNDIILYAKWESVIASIDVEKVWNDGNNADGKRPASINVTLIGDGTPVSGSKIELNDTNNWEGSWTNVPVNNSGVAIVYTVAESEVPTEYTSTITGSIAAGFTVTNDYTADTHPVFHVEKIWDDSSNADSKRPASLVVNLMDGITVVDTIILTGSSDTWIGSFTSGYPANNSGIPIVYTVEEVVPTDYSVSYGGLVVDTFTITNSYSSGPKYTVTYHDDDADSGTPPVDPLSPYFAGVTVGVLDNTDLVKANHTFAGWNTTGPSGIVDYVSGNSFLMPAANVNLYPVWTENPKYTVTYHDDDADSGTIPVDVLSPYYSGSTVVVLDNIDFVNATHTFAGWSLTGAGSTTVDHVASNTFVITANTDLYPVWIENGKFVVTYHNTGADSGIVPVDSLSPYFSGSTVTVLDNIGNLAKTNNAFVGWNLTGGTTVNYVAADTFVITANTDLYPVWTPNPTYTVTYYLHDSSSITYTDGIAYNVNDVITVETLSDVNATAHTYQGQWTRPGYTFTGWKYVPTAVVPNASSQFDMPASNVQIIGTWTSGGGPGPGPGPGPSPSPSYDSSPQGKPEIVEEPLLGQNPTLVFPMFIVFFVLAAAIVGYRWNLRRIKFKKMRPPV